jgi:hypothetical protein
VIQAIVPLCFTPEMYVNRPEFADTLADFVPSRPAQPLDAFLAQTAAVMAHDASQVLGARRSTSCCDSARDASPGMTPERGRPPRKSAPPAASAGSAAARGPGEPLQLAQVDRAGHGQEARAVGVQMVAGAADGGVDVELGA